MPKKKIKVNLTDQEVESRDNVPEETAPKDDVEMLVDVLIAKQQEPKPVQRPKNIIVVIN